MKNNVQLLGPHLYQVLDGPEFPLETGYIPPDDIVRLFSEAAGRKIYAYIISEDLSGHGTTYYSTIELGEFSHPEELKEYVRTVEFKLGFAIPGEPSRLSRRWQGFKFKFAE